LSESVLILGGGLTGLQAAVELADAGVKTVVVERGPILGGKRAAWLHGDSGVDPRLAEVAGHPDIELLTLSELVAVSGDEGNFTATVRQLPRYVNADCTRCNHCAPVCPQAVPNEYDAGLTYRKAIHSPFPRTIPDIFAIDIDACLNMPPNYLPCQRCVEVCDDRAIHFDVLPRDPVKRQVAAIIVSTGYVEQTATEVESLAEFGYGRHPDILSSVELQRLLEDPGPSGGFAVKPSDESYPDSVLLVLTRPSANAAWVMGNQLRRLAGQQIDRVEALVLSADLSTPDTGSLRQAAAEAGVTLAPGNWIGMELSDDGRPRPRYARFDGGALRADTFDLVVLSSEVQPDPGARALGELLGLDLDEQGYLQPSRAGIHLAGGVLGTVGIEAGAEQARAVAQGVLERLRPAPEPAVAAHAGIDQPGLEKLLQALLKLGEPGS
jgi:heterodisulfide reductase subunit A